MRAPSRVVGSNVTQPTSVADPARSGAGIARGALLIAGLTILTRILGLVRTLVFSQSIGASCLGTAYVTANQVPNLVYELVLGGALTSAMVPVLARSAERAHADPAEKARVGQITSALLTWSVVILVPLSLAIAVAAGPVATLLNPVNPNAHCPRGDMIATTTSMLVVFAPQALLYGLSVVLYGLLQAYRRFAGPTIGPAISSLVLIAAYLSFVPLAKGLPLAALPLAAELVLSVGTTLGVAALVVVGAVPTWRLHLRLRPTLRFPPGVARRASGLALVGVAELIAVDVASLVTIALANGRGATGALVIFSYASQVFNTVSAVLALSIVTSAFPVLSARDGPVFARTCAGSTRAVLLMSWLGAALIAAVAVPAAHVLAKQPDQVPELIEAFALFAPGIAGTAVTANLARVMLVIGRLKVAAVAVAGSWVAGDRGRRGAGRARPGPPGGRRPGAGEHHRPERGGRPADRGDPPGLRPGRRRGHRPCDAGRAGRRRGGGRGRRGREPGRHGRREAAGRGGGRGRGGVHDGRLRRRRVPAGPRGPQGRGAAGAAGRRPPPDTLGPEHALISLLPTAEV